MLNYQDEQRVRQIIRDEVPALVKKELEPTATNVDKILKMFIDLKQVHTLTESKVTKHDKRLNKIEKKLKIASPTKSAIFS